MIPPDHAEVIDDFAAFGVTAFTTTRAFGTLSAASDKPGRAVSARWDALQVLASSDRVTRLATAHQVHGAKVLTHDDEWTGWRRAGEADGHFAPARGVAMAVSVADCVPVFIAHPSGALALLHSGWRGTAARIVEQGIAAFTARGLSPADLRVHLGPAICGKCYEVSGDVASQLIGSEQPKRTVDLRALIADHARALGVREVTTSVMCTRCNNDRFFSHRCGDAGRQVALAFARPG